MAVIYNCSVSRGVGLEAAKKGTGYIQQKQILISVSDEAHEIRKETKINFSVD